MPRGDECTHPECRSWGEGCRQLTDEELTPTAEDNALAEQLVAEGWIQTSSKYRHIKRWRIPPPLPGAMLTPEVLDSPFAQLAFDTLKKWFADEHQMRMCNDERLVENRTLTVRQFKAWKWLKNKPWREYLERNRAARTAPPKQRKG